MNDITLLENVCRTCMNGEEEDNIKIEEKNNKTFSIFNEPESMECKNTTIVELLLLITPQISIDSGDMLPKTLCESCVERLINAYKFQKMCIKADRKLREMIADIPVESQIKDPLRDISMDNVIISQAITDLSRILKIEMDEPLIDQNETTFTNKSVIKDTEILSFDTKDNLWEDMNDSADSRDIFSDRDSEWQKSFINKNNKSKKRKKIVKQINDDTIKEKEHPSEVTNDSKEKGQNPNKAKDHGSKKFECDDCGSRLSTHKSLKRHKGIHLKTVVAGQKNTFIKTKYECDFCKKAFQQSSSLKDHLRIHTGEQPYLCSECGKAFKSLSNMKQHFLRHGTDRPYICPDCPKKFPCLSDLASHKAVHNKTKSHICDICAAAFVKPYLLKKHKMYHTGEKNHKCDYCDMRFVLADQCRRHMRTHTGEKPYKCKYCERAFAQSNDLIKHLRGHLGNNVYKCDLCPQGFRLQGDLRAHFNTHKNDDEVARARNMQALKDE